MEAQAAAALDDTNKDALLKVFQRIDVNNSGRIDADELCQIVVKMLPTSTSREDAMAAVRQLIGQTDTDGDGQIDYPEFVACLAGDLSGVLTSADDPIAGSEADAAEGEEEAVALVASVASVASSSLLGTDSPWVGRAPPAAVLPRPAVALRPRNKVYYRKPPPAVPVPPSAVTILPCASCREIGSESQPDCRVCARALRKAKAKAAEERGRAAVRPIRVVARQATDPPEGTAPQPTPTREERCRDRVLSARRQDAEWNAPLAEAAGSDGEAMLAGRPQYWVRHRPLHDTLVPPRVGDLLVPDEGTPAEGTIYREERATVTAIADGVVHVQWSSDGSVGTILEERIRLPVTRPPNAATAPTTASAGKYRTPEELQRAEQHLATANIGFLSTCDALGPTHPRASSHPVQQPLANILRAPPQQLHQVRVPASITGSKPAVFHGPKRSSPRDAVSTARDIAVDFSASFSQHTIATPNDVGRWTATVEGALERFQESVKQSPKVCASFRHAHPLKPALERSSASSSSSMQGGQPLSARKAAAGNTARRSAGATKQLGPLQWGEPGSTPTWAPHSPRHQFPTASRPVGIAADEAALLSVSRQNPTQTHRNGEGNPFHITANASMLSWQSLGSWDSGFGYREASPRAYHKNEDLQASWRAESISSVGKGLDSSADLALYKTDPEFPPTIASPQSALELSRSVEWAEEPLGSSGCGVPRARGSNQLLTSRREASPVRLNSDTTLQVTLTHGFDQM
jgi:hypothetical protein